MESKLSVHYQQYNIVQSGRLFKWDQYQNCLALLSTSATVTDAFFWAVRYSNWNNNKSIHFNNQFSTYIVYSIDYRISQFIVSYFLLYLNIKCTVYNHSLSLLAVVNYLSMIQQNCTPESYLCVFYCVVLYNIENKSQVWSETLHLQGRCKLLIDLMLLIQEFAFLHSIYSSV